MNTLYRDFEQDWHAQIEAHGRRTKYEPKPWYIKSDQDEQHQAPINYTTEQVYRVIMAEPDLDALVRASRDHVWHAYVQTKYPHLREAYMNYLAQVYLTMDPQDLP